jgi:hypothetical protein
VPEGPGLKPQARGSFWPRIHRPDITAFAERCVAKGEPDRPHRDGAAGARNCGRFHRSSFRRVWLLPLIPRTFIILCEPSGNEKDAMNKVFIGVVSAADFERARGCVAELSNYGGYDDWLNSRYGRFMGLSLGGADASLVTVVLEDFLGWCGDRKIRPSEAALDIFAQDSVLFLSSVTAGPLINLA